MAKMMDSEKRKKRIYEMSFSTVYPLYIQKVEKKGQTKKEVDQIIRWLTGYSDEEIKQNIDNKTCIEAFFNQAINYNINSSKITGTICGYRVEEIEDKIEQRMRKLDKLIDELAKGRDMEKILRE
jgi:hypothetical protein